MTECKKIILWGGTGQAKVINECLRHSDEYEIIAIFDNNENVKSPIDGVPIFYKREGFEKWIKDRKEDRIYFSIAIGGDKGYDRVEIHKYLEGYGLESITITHPKSNISYGTNIGNGSQVLLNATLGPEVQIGMQTIINTSAIVDHDCILGNGVHICPGAHLAGEIRVLDFSMIGTGAIILPKLKIGTGVVIGAGAVVTKDVEDYAIVVGNPGRIIGYNECKKERKK